MRPVHGPKGFSQLPIVALRNGQMHPLPFFATGLQQREGLGKHPTETVDSMSKHFI